MLRILISAYLDLRHIFEAKVHSTGFRGSGAGRTKAKSVPLCSGAELLESAPGSQPAALEQDQSHLVSRPDARCVVPIQSIRKYYCIHTAFRDSPVMRLVGMKMTAQGLSGARRYWFLLNRGKLVICLLHSLKVRS